MLTPILVTSGILFWIIIFLCVTSTSYYVERDNGVAAGIILILAAAVVTAFSTFNPFLWLIHNWATALVAAVLYVIMGVAYTRFYRYPKFVRKRVAEYGSNEAYWKEQYQKCIDKKTFIGPYSQYLEENHDMPPMPNKHKLDIIYWMSYWPFSLAWTLLWKPFELIRDLFEWIYEKIAESLKQVARDIFKRIVGDVNAKIDAASKSGTT